MTRARGTAAAVLAAFLLAAGCSRRAPDYRHLPDAGIPAFGGARIEAAGGEAATLDPILASDSASANLCSLVFDGLLRYGPKLTLEGDLARSWSVRDGGRTIVFRLRPGVRWQDGAPFTSADAAFTEAAIMDPRVPSPLKSGFDLVESVATPDPLTLVVRYRRPFAPALDAWTVGLLPRHLLQGVRDLAAAPFNRAPVGTGPYVFQSWLDKQYVEFKANPSYFGGPVRIARVLVKFVPEPATQLLELETGGIDGMTLQPGQYLHRSGEPAFTAVARAFRYPGLDEYAYLGFNLARAPFNDVRVRRALSYAIDRGELIRGSLLGLGRPCSGPYSPLMAAYDPSVKPYPYDPARAAALLDEAGWTRGPGGLRAKGGRPLAFTILTNQGNEARERGALILQQQFARIGVRVRVRTLEWSALISQRIDTRDFDAVLLAWQLGLDPDEYAIWDSSQRGPGGLNFIGFDDPACDRLLEEGRTTFDPARRIAIYRAFHRRLAALQPVAFLYCPDDLSAVSLKFQGLLETPTGYDWYWPTRWYVPKSAQIAY